MARRRGKRQRRIPQFLPLPPDYRVSVQQVTTSEMRKHDGSGTQAAGQSAGADGLWDVDSQTIYIRRCLPTARKWYILSHEMHHVLADWQHHLLDGGIAKN